MGKVSVVEASAVSMPAKNRAENLRRDRASIVGGVRCDGGFIR